jgi:hypothetical protein
LGVALLSLLEIPDLFLQFINAALELSNEFDCVGVLRRKRWCEARAGKRRN